MDFAILIVDEEEWKNPNQDQDELFAECQKLGVNICRADGWKQLWTENTIKENCADEKKDNQALIITCSDEGIGAARKRCIPVIAFRNPGYEEKHGRQELFKAPVLIEDFAEADASFLNEVFDRQKGIPLKIGNTKRCQIREISAGDISRLYVLLDGNINKDSLHPMRLEMAEFEKFWISYCRDMYGFYGYGLWLVLKDSEIIGLAGFENADYEFVREPSVELAYWISPSYRRQGYAQEVCRFLLEYAAEHLHFHEVSVYIEKTNKASLDLAKRLGFLQAGTYQNIAILNKIPYNVEIGGDYVRDERKRKCKRKRKRITEYD